MNYIKKSFEIDFILVKEEYIFHWSILLHPKSKSSIWDAPIPSREKNNLVGNIPQFTEIKYL